MAAPLAQRLQEATDAASATEILAEALLAEEGVRAVRVWVLGPGDRCDTCLAARACDVRTRARCHHLKAGLGPFDRPDLAIERLPRDAFEREDLRAAAASGTPGGEPVTLALVAGGQHLGTALLRLERAPTPALRERLEARAALAAATLAHRLLEGRDAERRHQIGLLGDLARKVGTILDDELLLRQAAADVRRTFGFPDVMIFLRDDAEEAYTLHARSTASEGTTLIGRRVMRGEGVVGRAVRTGRTMVVGDVAQDPDFVAWRGSTRSEIAVPILMHDRVEGVINVESDDLEAFGPTERLVLETVAHQLAIALENARLFALVREREERYRALVEANPGAVLHLDTAGRIVFQNPAACRLTGRDDLGEPGDRHAAGTGPHVLADLVRPADREAFARAFEDALAGRGRDALRLRLEHRDGSPRWVEASLRPLVDDGGLRAGVLVLARDVSREKELQEKLYQAEKLGAIGGLVSGVAHELNNPLAGILGYAQLLLSGPPDTWTHEDLEKIEHNARRCQAIVESLLKFARQSRVRKHPANLNEVIESVLKLNEYALRAEGIGIEKHYDPRMPQLDLDLNQWQQVIINLAANAQQAIAAGGRGTKTIRFETRVEEGEAVVTVEDSGPGIPAEHRARLFEPFFTTKETGTGLGLSICYGIVQEHGGTIELDPEFEDGTRFVLRLPIGRAPANLKPASAPAAVPPGASPGGLVLILDDEPVVRDVVEAWFTRHHFEVACCERGEEALERCRELDPDVLLVDVALRGGMDGLEFHDRLAARAPDLARRVIFVTGYASHHALAREIERRGVTCLHKPFDLGELLQEVRRLAARSGTQRVEK